MHKWLGFIPSNIILPLSYESGGTIEGYNVAFVKILKGQVGNISLLRSYCVHQTHCVYNYRLLARNKLITCWLFWLRARLTSIYTKLIQTGTLDRSIRRFRSTLFIPGPIAAGSTVAGGCLLVRSRPTSCSLPREFWASSTHDSASQAMILFKQWLSAQLYCSFLFHS